MSADVLREAAALMRERARVSTAGPWFAVASGVEGSGTVFHDKHVLHNDADHIASWHPAVALAVANWLDVFADDDWPYNDCADEPCEYAPCLAMRRALEVARAYLGRTHE